MVAGLSTHVVNADVAGAVEVGGAGGAAAAVRGEEALRTHSGQRLVSAAESLARPSRRPAGRDVVLTWSSTPMLPEPSRSVVQTVLCCADTALGATRAVAAGARVFIMVGERTRVLAAAALLDVTGARRNSDGHFEGPHQLANE